jgi:hypothetical protein
LYLSINNNSATRNIFIWRCMNIYEEVTSTMKNVSKGKPSQGMNNK